MIKIENTEVYGFDAAIRGMRNPMNSWDKSDSRYRMIVDPDGNEITDYWIGASDLKLMQTLAKAGPDHGKFLRMINVTCDITAPLYWFKEYDTYKVGTVANSCSTMHKIHAKEFTLDDFSHEYISESYVDADNILLTDLIEALNFYRDVFNDTKDKRAWYKMIQLLPTSYNQKRTVQLNYQVLKNMYHARKSHKLDEWREFCKWIETLPCFCEIVIGD